MRLALGIGFCCFLIALAGFAMGVGDDARIYGPVMVYGGIARSAFYIGLAVGGCTFAIREGGSPERIAGWIILAGLIADPLLHLVLHPRFHSVDPTHLIIDASRLAGFGFLAVRAHRYWPIWLTAFQLLSMGAHVAKVMTFDLHPVIYQAMDVMWSYGMLLVLIAATQVHRKLIAAGRNRKSWSDFSRRSVPMDVAPPGI